ncbi:hypothetical protein C8A00DRAFT_37889 [Chaetomidium leptoderma]|uniref:Uncharacterized protein n=1 Tax=Chaetomidium leptoderma TaxID=669021 RepID=A0AAN6VDL5_9PEZI|nr:hypothetical protein C8A00DRAFT_37889 [Chaetomidium leptoderma]
MDHFNATVKDGKLVKTRRGLQVSRQKFNGLSFVNTSPHDTSSGPDASGATGVPGPAQHEIRFVEEGSESQSEGIHRKDADHLECSDTSQGTTKRRPRPSRRGKSPARSKAGTPPHPSPPPPFQERSFQLDHTAASRDVLHIGSNSDTRTPIPGPPLLSEEDWSLFERYFHHIRRSMYPYEDLLTYNPARAPDFHAMVTADVAALHCVLMCGSIIEAVSSQAEPKELAYHISKICAILNQKLNQDHAADAVTLHCIATLASAGCYVGRLDHWHLHMSGLGKVLDLNGGLAGLPPWLLAEIHRVDLKGSTALASSPCFPFTQQYSSISTTILPLDVREQTANSISALLIPLHIHPEVITTLNSLTTFASAIHQARQSPDPPTLDPHAFTEQWQAITHALLSKPTPLRDDTQHSNPYYQPPPPSDNNNNKYMSTHRLLPSSIPILPTATTTSSGVGVVVGLEPALRITALLYLKELLPDFPRNLGGYAVLLALLRYHLEEVMVWLRQPDDGVVLLRGPECRRVVASVCLVGDTVSRIADGNEGRRHALTTADDDDDDGGECYPREVFRDCLREVVGLEDVDDDGLDEGDLRVLFDLGMVCRGGEEGEGWDGWAALRAIVRG